MHSRSLSSRRPAALEIDVRDDLDAYDVAQVLSDALAREHGLRVYLEHEDDCLFLPPPYEVYRDGRTLRGDEHDDYASAVLAAASGLPVRAVRFAFEELCPFDWDAFGDGHWAALQAAYASLPGWLPGDGGLARWFGRDERKGPYVWASVEPPGLQVAGLLEADRLDEWHAGLLASTQALPQRRPGW